MSTAASITLRTAALLSAEQMHACMHACVHAPGSFTRGPLATAYLKFTQTMSAVAVMKLHPTPARMSQSQKSKRQPQHTSPVGCFCITNQFQMAPIKSILVWFAFLLLM